MCGILGVVDNKGVNIRLLEEMRDTMSHRGPDGAGVWISPDGTIGLAHRRLSILDLTEAGKQPMADCSGRIWITYNGETYNFKDIREELVGLGHSFKSHTDTEVVINAYKEWGTDCIQRFNGMFAFCIYDSERRQLFMARDRAGKKPFYYAHYNGMFAFASELKALIKDNALSKEIDPQALNFYLAFGYIPGELCIFSKIKKLPPAHAMTYNLADGVRRIWRYWELPLAEENNLSEDELLEELESLLKDSVRLRMTSDVPLGAFLSGGVDSSLIVAMMRKVSNGSVKTFSIGFDEGKYNELPYAKIVAKHFMTDHHEIMVRPESFAVLPELIRKFDEPFADASMIPTYYLSKATRDHVTVALSGDGGDELFGGYTKYIGTLCNYYAATALPSGLRKVMACAAGYLPEKFPGKRQMLRLKSDPYGAFIDRSCHLYFKESYRRELLGGYALSSEGNFTGPEDSVRGYLTKRRGGFIDQLTYSDFMTYLPDDILVKVDRASMMVSLEARAPLLDYRIADFAFKKVPERFKIKGMSGKYLLKKLTNSILPQELNLKGKRGFSVPVSEWFRGALYTELRETLLGDDTRFFNKVFIKKLLDEHREGMDHGMRLYALLVFVLWKREYGVS